jgi:hypothetical protein
MYLRKTEYDGVHCIHLTQNKVQWRTECSDKHSSSTKGEAFPDQLAANHEGLSAPRS